MLGDYEIAKEKAQIVITSYAMTSHLKDAEETMQDILKNMEKEKKILATISDKKPADNAVAVVEPEKFVDAPVLKPATEPATEPVAEPEVVAPVRNTLKIKNKTQEEVNQKAIQKPTDKPDEGIEDKNAGKNDLKNPPIKNALYQDKSYQEASDLVKEGKELMKKANSYDNPGNKNAQMNYQKALTIFKSAVAKLNKISKKFAGNEEFEELAQQASGMEFFITKSCLRIKY